jgi:hypothetical protein
MAGAMRARPIRRRENMTTKTRKTTEAPAQSADTIALSQLIPDPKNVRRYESEAGITDLCAQIVSQGLLQNGV